MKLLPNDSTRDLSSTMATGQVPVLLCTKPARIRSFSKIIEDDAGTSGMVLDQIRVLVRNEPQERDLDSCHAAEDFLKLYR